MVLPLGDLHKTQIVPVVTYTLIAINVLVFLVQQQKGDEFTLAFAATPYEIWHNGYYPVVWTNKKFKMIYVNMGHNDMDYEHKFDNTNRTLSFTFDNQIQDRLIVNCLLWLGEGRRDQP